MDIGQLSRKMPNHFEAITEVFNAVSNGLERADMKATYDRPETDERCAHSLVQVRVSAYKVDGDKTIRIDVAAEQQGFIFG